LAYPDKDFDMVIAVDFQLIEELLGIYGPLEVEGVRFDQQNFFEVTQKMSKDVDTHNVEQLEGRKGILGPFGNRLIKKVMRSPTKYGIFFELIAELIQEKHILAYSQSEAFQQKLEDFGLAQRIKHEQPSHDFLHVNVANIGGRKADRYVTKDIKYRADFSDPTQAKGILTIDLEHLGSYNIQSDIYQAYIRSYVPFGSTLLRPSPTGLKATETAQDLGLTYFADYIRLKPGESVTLSYEYELPEYINAEQYQLEVIKQPGVQNQYWQIANKQVNDSMLENLSLEDRSTTPFLIRENLALWKGEPKSDLYFSLRRGSDRSPPIILWQEFVDLKTINVRFNELLEESMVNELGNYKITDLNEKNSISDSITVTSVRFSERDLWLTVDGITEQAEEHYQLVIRDLADVSGNLIEPNPVVRTLVQRLDESVN